MEAVRPARRDDPVAPSSGSKRGKSDMDTRSDVITVLSKDGKKTSKQGSEVARPSIIDCSGNFLTGKDGAESFAKLVSVDERDYDAVKHLKFSNNKTGPDGIAALVKGLASFNNVKILELENNFLGGGGLDDPDSGGSLDDPDSPMKGSGDPMEQMAKVFVDMRNLTTLRLRGNNFGRAETGVKSLAKAFENGKESLSGLQFLYLSNNKLGWNDAIQHLVNPLSHFTNLLALDLSDNGIGPKGAEHLERIISNTQNLLELQLSGNCFGSDGARCLVEPMKSMKKLRTVDLSKNDLGSGGAQCIADVLIEIGASISVVDLSHNNFGPRGAACISSCLSGLQKATQLNMASNNLGSAGAEQLASGLQNLTRLIKLNLSSNSLGTRGISFLAPSIDTLSNLKAIDLSNNFIGTGGVPHVASIMKKRGKRLHSLNLSSNALLGDGCADGSLSTNELHHQFADALAATPCLIDLNLSCNDLGVEGGNVVFSTIENWGRIRLSTLDLSSNALGSDGVSKLANVLAKMRSLKTLDLSSNQLGEEGARKLSHKLGHVKELNLSSNSLGSSEKSVESMSEAISLPIGGQPGGNIATAVVLTKLDLSCNYIGVKGGLQHLEQVLRNHCSSLKKLNLSSNNIGQNRDLYDAISSLKYLAFLDLSSNALGVKVLGAASAAHKNNAASAGADRNQPELHLAIAVGSLEELTHLNLSSNQLGNVAFQHLITHALSNKRKLSHLDVSHNRLVSCDSTDIEKFAGIVHDDLEALSDLNVKSNGFESDDKKLEVLKSMRSLKRKLGVTFHISEDEDANNADSNNHKHSQEQQRRKDKMKKQRKIMMNSGSSSSPGASRGSGKPTPKPRARPVPRGRSRPVAVRG